MSVNAIACSSTPEKLLNLSPASWSGYLELASRSPGANESLPKRPTLQWKVNVGRGVPGGIAVTPDLIVAGSSNRLFTVLDRATGEELWQKRLVGSVPTVPVIEGTHAFIGTEFPRGHIYAFDLSRRDELWEIDPGPLDTHLALADRMLLAKLPSALVALDPETGERLWATALPGPARAAPTLADSFVAVATVNDSLFLLRLSNGTIAARFKLPGSVVGAPAYENGLLAAGTGDGWVVGIDVQTQEIAWRLNVRAPVVGSVAIARDTVFALTRPGVLWFISPQHPEAAVNVALHRPVTAGPTPLKSGVLIATTRGEILHIKPGALEPSWVIAVDGPLLNPPIVKGGEMIVTDGFGNILLYR